MTQQAIEKTFGHITGWPLKVNCDLSIYELTVLHSLFQSMGVLVEQQAGQELINTERIKLIGVISFLQCTGAIEEEQGDELVFLLDAIIRKEDQDGKAVQPEGHR